MPTSCRWIRHLPVIPILISGIMLLILSGCQPGIPATPEMVPTAFSRTPVRAVSSATVTITSRPTLPVAAINTTATVPTECADKSGRLEERQFDSKVIGKTVRVNIYLPACYNPAKQHGYPVLFLLHGQGQDENFWADAGLVEKSDALILSNDAIPFLVVMPNEEYNTGDILKSNFGDMFVNELVPWVNDNFAVSRDFRLRAIGGNSRGAYWAFRLAYKYKAGFGAVGAHSLPFFGEPNALRLWLNEIPVDEMPRLYLDIGEQDRYLNDALKFKALLDNYGVPHQWYLNQGEHNAAYWQDNLEKYLSWYTLPWSEGTSH